jgi:hypothetical protein
VSRLYDRTMRQVKELSVTMTDAQYSSEMRGALGDEIVERFKASLNACTVVSADEVARYWHGTLGKDWLWWDDLPALTPPLSPVFIEARWPYGGWPKSIKGEEPYYDSGTKQGEVMPTPHSVGLLCETEELDEEASEQLDATNPPRWSVDCLCIAEWTKGRIMPMAAFSVLLDAYGKYPDRNYNWLRPWWMRGTGVGGTMLSVRMTMPLFLAISFMHCKNVSLPTVEPPSPVSRKAEQRYGRPLTRYRVLEIMPMREILNREGAAERTGLKRALHICRGHFATYSDEKPLFGKYAGTYWKPQHVRGSKARGEVVKDYAVKTGDKP